MSTSEMTFGVPADKVEGLIEDYRAIGAIATKVLKDGSYTVTAVFPGSVHLAPLAMTSVEEAVPVATGPLVEAIPRPMMQSDFGVMAPEYRHCFDVCQTRPAHAAEIKVRVARLLDNASRYKALAKDTNIPWYFIAIVHMMESNTNFNAHLHNGDPLSQRTVRVPIGRPLDGAPPFTWETSAFDALHYEGFTGLDDWNTATMLYRWERFNGMGYRAKGMFSPYLWSYSNLYEKGRFVADHVFDPDSVSKQCGAGVLLKALQGIV